ncbi:MAG: hypothetical protein FWF15_00840 [Oscillospiraceae bacterium]|nr:hypothetical protein [Oscillospiraceae bacterium]
MKRIIALSLILLLIMSFISACSSGSNSSAETTTKENQLTVENKDWTFGDAWVYMDDNLPAKNFGGAEFNILTMDYQYHDFTVIVDNYNGDVLNDAIYKRTIETEERFNVKITSTLYTDFWNSAYVKKLVTSGDSTYDLIWMIERIAVAAAMENLLYPLQDVEYIDLKKPYWGGDKMISSLTVNKISYFGVPDYNLIAYNSVNNIVFNKNLHENLQLENIYDLVLSGKWTYDNMLSLAQAAVADLNGDGIISDGDQFGFTSNEPYLVFNFFNGANVYTVSKDKDDLPYFALPGNQKAADIYEKVFKDYYESDVFFKIPLTGVESVNFRNGQSLFFMGALSHIFKFRDMEDDFGLLPVPKYDETQTEYLTAIPSLFLSVVPTTVENIERTGIILEALACSSYNTVIPEYYEKCLTTKFVRDAESAEVISLILKNRVTDFGNIFIFADIEKLLFYVEKQEFSSYVESITPKVEININKVIDYFMGVE